MQLCPFLYVFVLYPILSFALRSPPHYNSSEPHELQHDLHPRVNYDGAEILGQLFSKWTPEAATETALDFETQVDENGQRVYAVGRKAVTERISTIVKDVFRVWGFAQEDLQNYVQTTVQVGTAIETYTEEPWSINHAISMFPWKMLSGGTLNMFGRNTIMSLRYYQPLLDSSRRTDYWPEWWRIAFSEHEKQRQELWPDEPENMQGVNTFYRPFIHGGLIRPASDTGGYNVVGEVASMLNQWSYKGSGKTEFEFHIDPYPGMLGRELKWLFAKEYMSRGVLLLCKENKLKWRKYPSKITMKRITIADHYWWSLRIELQPLPKLPEEIDALWAKLWSDETRPVMKNLDAELYAEEFKIVKEETSDVINEALGGIKANELVEASYTQTAVRRRKDEKRPTDIKELQGIDMPLNIPPDWTHSSVNIFGPREIMALHHPKPLLSDDARLDWSEVAYNQHERWRETLWSDQPKNLRNVNTIYRLFIYAGAINGGDRPGPMSATANALNKWYKPWDPPPEKAPQAGSALKPRTIFMQLLQIDYVAFGALELCLKLKEKGIRKYPKTVTFKKVIKGGNYWWSIKIELASIPGKSLSRRSDTDLESFSHAAHLFDRSSIARSAPSNVALTPRTSSSHPIVGGIWEELMRNPNPPEAGAPLPYSFHYDFKHTGVPPAEINFIQQELGDSTPKDLRESYYRRASLRVRSKPGEGRLKDPWDGRQHNGESTNIIGPTAILVEAHEGAKLQLQLQSESDRAYTSWDQVVYHQFDAVRQWWIDSRRRRITMRGVKVIHCLSIYAGPVDGSKTTYGLKIGPLAAILNKMLGDDIAAGETSFILGGKQRKYNIESMMDVFEVDPILRGIYYLSARRAWEFGRYPAVTEVRRFKDKNVWWYALNVHLKYLRPTAKERYLQLLENSIEGEDPIGFDPAEYRIENKDLPSDMRAEIIKELGGWAPIDLFHDPYVQALVELSADTISKSTIQGPSGLHTLGYLDTVIGPKAIITTAFEKSKLQVSWAEATYSQYHSVARERGFHLQDVEAIYFLSIFSGPSRRKPLPDGWVVGDMAQKLNSAFTRRIAYNKDGFSARMTLESWGDLEKVATGELVAQVLDLCTERRLEMGRFPASIDVKRYEDSVGWWYTMRVNLDVLSDEQEKRIRDKLQPKYPF